MIWQQDGDVLYKAPAMVVHDPNNVLEVQQASFTIPGGSLTNKALISIQTIWMLDGAVATGNVNTRLNAGGIGLQAQVLSSQIAPRTETINRLQYLQWAESNTEVLGNDTSDKVGWGYSNSASVYTLDNAADITIYASAQNSAAANKAYLSLFEIRVIQP